MVTKGGDLVNVSRRYLDLMESAKILAMCGDKVRCDDSIRYPYDEIALRFLYHAQCYMMLEMSEIQKLSL